MQAMAKKRGLWNLFLPSVSGFTQTEYALIAEQTGRYLIAPECLNCSAPGKERVVWISDPSVWISDRSVWISDPSLWISDPSLWISDPSVVISDPILAY